MWALQAGKNLRLDSDQFGHADPSTTLRHYAYATRKDVEDLSFLNLGDGIGRHKTAPLDDSTDLGPRNYLFQLVRREGFEPPTLRFEA